jgi:type II pantothenate kinase
VEAADQITSAFGAFGKFTAEHKLRISSIRQIVLTGVGAAYLSGGMYDIPTKRINEFKAIGLGGLHLAGLEEAIIVSMGTGTALVKANKKGITHLGGSGVGGGTMQKLCGRFAGAHSFESITEMAAQGDLRNVDLTIADISPESIAGLPPEATVSNFGNLKDSAAPGDIVLGIINMTFESIGMMAVFATRNDAVRDVVLTGSLTTMVQAARVFDTLSEMHPVCFHVPPNAIYATAAGAALSELR